MMKSRIVASLLLCLSFCTGVTTQAYDLSSLDLNDSNYQQMLGTTSPVSTDVVLGSSPGFRSGYFACLCATGHCFNPTYNTGYFNVYYSDPPWNGAWSIFDCNSDYTECISSFEAGNCGVYLEHSSSDFGVGVPVDIVSVPPTPPQWGYPILPYDPGSYAGRSFFYDENHLGEDIAEPEGTPIKAVGLGQIVWYAKTRTGYGELVAVVEHDLGTDVQFTNAYGESVTTRYLLSIYGHLRQCDLRRAPTVCTNLKVGDTVGMDTVIGYINDDKHNGDGAEHLHMGIRLSDAATAKARDPRSWFRGYERGSSFGTDFAAPSQVIEILLQQ